MKKLIALAMVVVMGVLAGCNTMAGLGRDVERGGEKLQKEANEQRR